MNRVCVGLWIACSAVTVLFANVNLVNAQERDGAKSRAATTPQARMRKGLEDRSITDQQLLDLIRFASRLQAGVEDESITTKAAVAKMKDRLLKLASPPQRGTQRMRQRVVLDVKDPKGFVVDEKNPVYSGPQSGEAMPEFSVTRINGKQKNKKVDLSADPSKRQLYIFQDNAINSLRGLLALNRSISKIKEASEVPLEIEIVFLGDDPVELASLAGRIEQYISDSAGMSLSNDGRDGPGVVGLNREVNVTLVMVKDGKVLHNFAMAQPMPTNPYIFGAIAELVDMPAEKAKAILNADQVEGGDKMMKKSRR